MNEIISTLERQTPNAKPILYLLAPAYNESQNISQFISEWYPVVEKYDSNGLSRLVIIDDGSKDNTYEIIKNLSQNKPLLIALSKQNSGHGPTLIYGYNYAIEHGADLIFQTDSDGQTLASEFDSFWEKINDYDAVIGKRLNREDGLSRKFVEKVLCLILKVIFGVKIRDSNAPFRLMKSYLVRKYIAKLPSDFNLPNVMLTTYFMFFHENVVFQSITFRPRQAGKNSINIKKIIKIGIKAVKDFMKLRKNIMEA